MRPFLALLVLVVAASACGFDAQVDVTGALPGPGSGAPEGPDAGAEPPAPGNCDGPMAGNECERVVDVEITEPFEPILATVMISDEVDAVACAQGVLVGFEAREQDIVGGMIGVRGVCGDTQVGPDGVVRWTASGLTDVLGDGGPPLGTTSCNYDELMVGVEFHTDAFFVSGLAPICARWTVQGAALAAAETVTRDVVGDGAIVLPRECGDGRAVGQGMGGSPEAGGFFSLGVICGDVSAVVE